MANEDQTKLETRKEPQTEKERIKKPYTKPAFRFERVFETQALSCGKMAGQGHNCSIHSSTS
jgi:hypothetical protein